MKKKSIFCCLSHPSSLWYFTMEAWTAIPLRVKAKVYPTARGLTHFPRRPPTLTLLPFILFTSYCRHAAPCQAYSHFGGLCFLYLEQIASKYLHNILSHSKVTSMMSSYGRFTILIPSPYPFPLAFASDRQAKYLISLPYLWHPRDGFSYILRTQGSS